MTDATGQRTPALNRTAFDCPNCQAFSQQIWFTMWSRRVGQAGNMIALEDFSRSQCTRCGASCIWLNEALLYPATRIDVPPHEDMPDNVRALYEGARTVGGVSRKSAAALIRLALQTLVDHLEPGSGDVNKKIGRLVSKGLDSQVQQAMDVLRVVGNNAVHPGQIDLDGDDDLVPSLFALANLVVEQMISRPKRMQSLYDALPDAARAAIAKRDAGSAGQVGYDPLTHRVGTAVS